MHTYPDPWPQQGHSAICNRTKLPQWSVERKNVVRYTKGFESPYVLADHYDRHKSDFDVGSEEEYEEKADTFLGGPLGNKRQCERRNGDILRFDPDTREFGILRKDRVIKTYYKPNPSKHKEPTNDLYFEKQCRK